MVALNKNQIDSLRENFSDDATAQAIFDLLARYKKARRELSVDVLEEKTDIARRELTRALRAFADAGLGRFVVGRRGHASRFVWDVPPVETAQAAANGNTAESASHEPEPAAPAAPAISVTLSSGRRIELPSLSVAEAAELAEWLRSRPL